ncbi:MAG: nucleotidyltransferase [Deltaproteobacteria bacterium]|nr:nucleotidyltransferase [Deltaproteobacteria bacterium]
MTSLEQALIKLAQTLSDNRIPYMIIGGMANAVWGQPRATLDIDVTIWFKEKEINRIVSFFADFCRPLVSDPAGFVQDTSVLPLESKDGVRIDLIFAKLSFEREAISRVVEIKVGGIPICFCSPEDLILYKIISERERDQDDARGVAVRRMKSLDLNYLEPRIRELAIALERPEIWKSWVERKQKTAGRDD